MNNTTKNKKGQFNLKTAVIGTVLTFIIGLIVILNVVGATVGNVSDAGESLANVNASFTTDENGTVTSSTSLPFASLFGSGGLVVLAFMAVVLLGVLGSMGLLKSKR